MSLSVLIIAHNEKDNIADAISSVSFADEVVVVDNGSDDDTGEIASKMGAKVIRSDENIGYADAKRLGIEHCAGEWILWLDADERISDELAEEIVGAVKNPENFAAFRMPRKSFFLKKWIRHCGWYPDYVLRLFLKNKARFSDDLVHEKVIVEGEVEKFSNPIIHHTDPDIEHYLKKLNHYTTLGARQMAAQGKRVSALDIVIRPVATFLRMFIIKLGFLDGMHGFVLSVFSAVHTMTKYAKLYFAAKR